MGLFGDIIDGIVDRARAIWDYIKKIAIKVLKFFNNIVSFFKDRNRLEKLKDNKDLLAVAIKENLENGNCNVVNCLFDKETNEIVDYEENAQGITAESLDSETKRHFGNKDMIVLT